MKLARLVQPRKPMFWLLLLLNGLSTVISYVLRSHEFAAPVILVLVCFALGNMIYGIRIAVRLMQEPAPLTRSAEAP